jgi:hypothetical protein
MKICVYKKGLFNDNHNMFVSLKALDGTSLIEPGYKSRLKLRYKIKHMFNLILYGKDFTEGIVTFDTSHTFSDKQVTMRVNVETYGSDAFASVVDRIIYNTDTDVLAIHCDNL